MYHNMKLFQLLKEFKFMPHKYA